MSLLGIDFAKSNERGELVFRDIAAEVEDPDTEVGQALSRTFVSVPSGIGPGGVPTWDGSAWVAGTGGGGGSAPDATTLVKGVVRLAGDLGGTADSPTVPGLASKAPLASPAFTGTPTGITKAHVGLGSVDNTADTAKPVSTAQAAADAAVLAAAIPKSLVDAKGDLIVATANDTPARLAVGADTHVLTADSTQAGGMKWAAPSGGGGAVLAPAGKTGWWIMPAGINFGDTGAQQTGNVPAARLVVPVGATFDRVNFRVTLEQAGVNARALLYSSDADGMPATLVGSWTTSIASGGFKGFTVSLTLPAGVYWGVVRTDTGTTCKMFGYYPNFEPQFSTASSDSYMGGAGTTVAFDPGTYASPASTISAWSLSSGPVNYFGIRRA